MELKVYVDQHLPRSQQSWVDAFGISRAHFNQLIAVIRKPSLAVMVRNEKATDCAVRLSSWADSVAMSEPPSIQRIHRAVSGPPVILRDRIGAFYRIHQRVAPRVGEDVDAPKLWFLNIGVIEDRRETPALNYVCLVSQNWRCLWPTRLGKRAFFKDLSVNHIAGPDCFLWLWATNPMLDVAYDVMRALGFQFKTAGHWSKKTKHGKQAFGHGYILRCAGEPFLIGTVGDPETARNVRSVIEGPVRDHSRKPDEAFAAAEHLCGNVNRIELFSRQEREGWDVMGDQIERFTA